MTMLPLDPETTPAATVPTEATASGTMTPEVAASEATDPSARAGAPAPRQTLAMRLAERSRMRAQRAERLARLRPGPETPMAAPVAAPIAVPVPLPAAGDAEAALEDFLRALTGGVPLPPAQPQEAAEVLPFQRVQEDAGPEGAANPAAMRRCARSPRRGPRPRRSHPPISTGCPAWARGSSERWNGRGSPGWPTSHRSPRPSLPPGSGRSAGSYRPKAGSRPHAPPKCAPDRNRA